jgi:hypothetical protein
MVPAPSTATDWIVCLILVATAGRNHLDGGWPAEKAIITLAVPCHRRNFVAMLPRWNDRRVLDETDGYG